MPNSARSRGRPKGPARKFGHQTLYAAYQAVREACPKKSPTEIARLVGEALHVPRTVGPHEQWIEVTFALADGVQPKAPIVIRASREAMMKAEVSRRRRIVLWQAQPCVPPDLPKQEMLGASANAIAMQVMRLMKAIGKQ
jgi:hypothetical protein